MATYRLKFSDDELGSAKEIEFDAHDAGSALAVAQGERFGRRAELWESERRLCTLRREGPRGEIWRVER